MTIVPLEAILGSLQASLVLWEGSWRLHACSGLTGEGQQPEECLQNGARLSSHT